jgi:hypothetical protein
VSPGGLISRGRFEPDSTEQLHTPYYQLPPPISSYLPYRRTLYRPIVSPPNPRVRPPVRPSVNRTSTFLAAAHEFVKPQHVMQVSIIRSEFPMQLFVYREGLGSDLQQATAMMFKSPIDS